ncbi:hypothetical protein PMAYCL1PPCAC_29964, partial [Pristionchus mayeri]
QVVLAAHFIVMQEGPRGTQVGTGLHGAFTHTTSLRMHSSLVVQVKFLQALEGERVDGPPIMCIVELSSACAIIAASSNIAILLIIVLIVESNGEKRKIRDMRRLL